MGGKSIMKKYVNGEYIDMTAEEVEALNSSETVEIPPTTEERLEAIEALLLEEVLLGD